MRHDDDRTDAELAAEAAAQLARSPSLQLVAELLGRLREMKLPWWTPQQLRAAYPAAERLAWLATRPDLRQRITTQLTGLAPRAARNKSPAFQAELIDSVVDEGDISVDEFEHAFDPVDLALYGTAADHWRLFRRRAPWDDDATAHQDLLGWLMGALLADKSSLDGAARRPLLTPLELRTAIDGRVWHTRIPLHVRVAIDDARFAHGRERPGEAFGAERDLAIATPALIAASIPLVDLKGVLDVAELRLGFGPGEPTARGSREPASKPARELEASDEGPRPDPAKEGEPPSPGDRAAPVGGATGEEPAQPEPQRSVSAAAPALAAEPAWPAAPAPSALGEAFFDEATADSHRRPGETDELEHTNPWQIPALAAETEKLARELALGAASSHEADRDDEE
jgi:hypothetical protein